MGGVSEKTIAGDMPENPPVPLDPGQPYLNAGLLVLALPKLRKSRTFERAMQLLRDHPGCCRWHDQSAINYVLNGNATLLDRSWNVQTRHVFYDPLDVMPALARGEVNVHFIDKAKPWLAAVPFAAEEMFRMLSDAVDPGWRDDPPVKTAMTSAKEHHAWAMPMLFKTRGWLRNLTGRSGFWDFREAGIWAAYNRDVSRLKQSHKELKALLDAWSARIQHGLHRG